LLDRVERFSAVAPLTPPTPPRQRFGPAAALATQSLVFCSFDFWDRHFFETPQANSSGSVRQVSPQMVDRDFSPNYFDVSGDTDRDQSAVATALNQGA
jgi:hypothetical protein